MANAEAWITGEAPNQKINLRLPSGAKGKSAYQVALDEGFVGTEAEWLESLKVKGDPGKDGSNVLPTEEAVSAAVSSMAVRTDADTVLPDSTKEWQVNVVDSPTNQAIPVHIDHHGTTKPGFDIRNRPGAHTAAVVHQYSNGTGVRLDNTGTGDMLLIAQTNNPLLNPNSVTNTASTGDAIKQVDHTGAIWSRLDGRGSWILTPPADATNETLRIIGNATSSKVSARITHNGPSNAVQIEQGVGAEGFYPLLINSRKFGPLLTTSVDSGVALRVQKNGTGVGTAFELTNKGTGASLIVKDAAGDVAKIGANGDIEVVNPAAGVVLKSPNGTRFRLTVGDDGALTTTAL